MGFNEAAGADPADAMWEIDGCYFNSWSFNEAAGADPADARNARADAPAMLPASMRPRGQTPRMQ